MKNQLHKNLTGDSPISIQKITFWILSFLPLLVTGIMLFFLPEQIPAHYNLNNQADRWGSKYESLILPFLNLGFGLIMLAVKELAVRQAAAGLGETDQKTAGQDETDHKTAGQDETDQTAAGQDAVGTEGEQNPSGQDAAGAGKGQKPSDQNSIPRSNEDFLLLCANIGLGIFNLLTFFFLYTSYHQVEDLSRTPVDINQLIYGALGFFMILMGNYMPKLRKNGMVGLRTSWSMKNEITWKKCQHFGGISFLIAGILIMISCFFTKGLYCVLWSSIILVIVVILDILYSWRIAQKY